MIGRLLMGLLVTGLLLPNAAEAVQPREKALHIARAARPKLAIAVVPRKVAHRMARKPVPSRAAAHPAGGKAKRHLPINQRSRAPAARTMSRRAVLPLVMIDPGHGGVDPGAVGGNGMQEKNVVLQTALELRRQILATRRYRVALTRDKDVFVSLAARLQAARRQHAALFISIHVDASPDATARGASVYTRSVAGGLQAVARHNAGRDSAKAIGHALSGLHTPMQGSAYLQWVMIGQLRSNIGLVDDPARQAQLYVLGEMGIPSVLLEMGFLSNRHDEKLLRQLHYRNLIAGSLKEAVDDYFGDLRNKGGSPT